MTSFLEGNPPCYVLIIGAWRELVSMNFIDCVPNSRLAAYKSKGQFRMTY